MEVLISNWSSSVQSIPKSYILPLDRQPGKQIIPTWKDIPVIDLDNAKGSDRAEIIQQILRASQDFGLFQVINHGVSKNLMNETMNVFKEFFGMPPEYKSSFYSHDPNRSCRLYTSTLNYDKEQVHYWRDNLTHKCHPLNDHIQFWPENPSTYREVVGNYSVETRKVLLRILELVCEGMGFEVGYFGSDLSKIQLLSVNHHVPCPDPSLTLGMPEHSDPNVISMIQQCDVSGFQAFKDGQWVGVDPLPNSFVVIAGLQLRVISNGKLTSPIHRVVTDSKEARTTIGTFITPSSEILIEPATDLVYPRPLYRPYTYKEFFDTFTSNNSEAEITLQRFKLQI